MMIKPEKTLNYPLRSIYFYPTESCNLRCIHCWVQPAHAYNDKVYQSQNQDNVSVEVMEKVVQDGLTLGLNHIKVTGGEPFLAPNLFEYLDVFSRSKLSLGIETNATLLTEDMVRRLKRCHLKQISVSLDGSSAVVHEKVRAVKGCFEKAITGTRYLIEHGIYPQVIFCLQKINAHDLENTIELADRLGVRSFEINPLSFANRASKTTMSEGLAIEEVLELERKVESEYSTRFPHMHIDLYLPPALKGMKELSKHRLCTCKILNICGILANGDVSICGIGRGNRALLAGNVKDQSIVQIWRQGMLFKEIREKIPFEMEGICGKCLFKFHCLGFCRADVLAAQRRLTDAYGLCGEVFQKGLFPKSRILDEKEFALIRESAPS
jgi:SynChlorMet cassette radical SAM/SPASM protein ScmF